MTRVMGLESEPYSGNWSVLKGLDSFGLDHKVNAAGGKCFFMAAEVKALIFGGSAPKNIGSGLRRILGKVSSQHFNCLEVTGIVAKRFLGVPYITVSAHSRHIQRSCYLDSAMARRAPQNGAQWSQE